MSDSRPPETEKRPAAVIAAGLKMIDGQVMVVELHARGGQYWLRLPNGFERLLTRDAARYVLDVIGDPDDHRSEHP
jgi:hypothetical protein